jgi:hypothetical protein
VKGSSCGLFEILSMHLSGGIEGNYKKSQLANPQSLEYGVLPLLPQCLVCWEYYSSL